MADNYVIGGKSLNPNSETFSLEKGVYSDYPGGSPRMGHNPLNYGGVHEVARLYVPLPSPLVAEKYLAAVTSYAPSAVKLAEVMVTGSDVGYVDFILSSVNENYSEKFQIDEVLSDQYISYFYGQHAPSFTISGALYNTEQDDWSVAFTVLYDAVLRGSRSASLGYPLTLDYGPRSATGVFTNFSLSSTADSQQLHRFQATMLVKKVELRPLLKWNVTRLSAIELSHVNAASLERDTSTTASKSTPSVMTEGS